METQKVVSSSTGEKKTVSASQAEAESTVEVKSKKFISTVWNHFTKIYKEDGKKYDHSVCKYCSKKYSNNTATSTLDNHLSKCNGYVYNKDGKKQKTLESIFCGDEGDSKLMPWKFDQNACREALAKMIIIDELPFSFIEHQGFKHFCNVACPRLQLVSRITIAKDCMKIYANLKKELKSALAFNAHRICLTTDLWTSLQNMSYMVLTAHFIDHDWKLHKRVLNFVVTSSHKGVAIGQTVESCMLEWGIEKVFTMTVDNASSNDTAIAHLKKKLSKRDAFVLDGDFFHMRCSAHILNLIVRDGIKEVEDSINNIRLAVRYIRSSPQRAQQFKTCCEQEQISCKSNLVLDVPTRWNYTFLMLDTALKFKKAFERLEEVEPSFLHDLKEEIPTESDWDNARVLTKFLKTFFEITKRLSGSLYVTANSYFHDVFLIETNLNVLAKGSDQSMKLMAIRMKEKFDKYWGDIGKINMMLLLAVVLDPRFKLKYVTFCYGTIYPIEKVHELERKIRETVIRMHAQYEMFEASSHRAKVGDSSNEMEVDQDGCVCSDEMISLQSAYYKHLDEENLGSKSEFDRYLGDEVEKKGDTKFSILEWWKVNSSRYRVLSLMARDVLAVPVTTVASESAFSTGGRVLDQFRSSLTPKVAEALLCAQDWLRAPTLPIDVEQKLQEMMELESTIMEDPELAVVM